MKIIDRLREDSIHISFEVFPPKTDEGFDKVIAAVDAMAGLNPAFISVTYGAGGGTSKNTAKIASHIKDDLHLLSLAHLTCASSTKEEVRRVIGDLKAEIPVIQGGMGVGISLSSLAGAAAKAGGTNIAHAFAPSFSTDSLIVLNTGTLPSKICPPFPGVTPATIFVP